MTIDLEGLSPLCWLTRHDECRLDQFYGRELDCECECHKEIK